MSYRHYLPVDMDSFPTDPAFPISACSSNTAGTPSRLVIRFISFTLIPRPSPAWITSYSSINLTRALLGGGGAFERPPGFSRIAKIRRRAAPPGFHPLYPSSFPQLLWTFRPKAIWGQFTRSGQVNQLQNNFLIAPRLQCFRESYETFGIWWGHQCLQNLYLGFFISVTSDQVIFATSPMSMGKK